MDRFCVLNRPMISPNHLLFSSVLVWTSKHRYDLGLHAEAHFAHATNIRHSSSVLRAKKRAFKHAGVYQRRDFRSGSWGCCFSGWCWLSIWIVTTQIFLLAVEHVKGFQILVTRPSNSSIRVWYKGLVVSKNLGLLGSHCSGGNYL